MPITAILLAAGYATRLYPLTKDRPKALLPLADGVIVDEVLGALDGTPGIRKRLLVTNHRFAEQFRQWQQSRGVDIQILDDGTDTAETRLGAIRDLELARQQTDPQDDLLVLGTDNLFSWPMADFVAQARRRRPDASIALWQAPSPEAAARFGVVVRDASGRITTFVEKSPSPPSADVALCVYYFPAPMCGTIRAFIAGGGNPDAPGFFLEWLVRRSRVYGVMMAGEWHDIGTPQEYEAVLQQVRRRNA